jgi:hypothetical protein
MACLNMGEVSGIAAALSLKKGIQPREIDRVELQHELLAAGMNIGQSFRTIPGVTDEAGEDFKGEHSYTGLWGVR